MYSRYASTDPNQGTASAQYIGENKLATKVAVIYDSSDVYSSGIEANIRRRSCRIRDLRLLQQKRLPQIPRQTSPHSFRRHRDAGAELVFLPIYYTEASIILTQANSMGYAPTFFGCDGLDGLLEC